jgi:hypothetical protein
MIWKDLNKEQRITLVADVWDVNSSAATIAAAIMAKLEGSELTRNSIIGFYHRNPQLAVSHPLSGGGRQKKLPPKKPKLVQLAETAVVLPKPEPRKVWSILIQEDCQAYDEASRQVTLFELGHHECHWAINEPEPRGQYLFCGHPVMRGKRYCEHHQMRATNQLATIKCQ